MAHQEDKASDHKNGMKVELFGHVFIPRKPASKEVHPHQGQDEYTEQQNLCQEDQ